MTNDQDRKTAAEARGEGRESVNEENGHVIRHPLTHEYYGDPDDRQVANVWDGVRSVEMACCGFTYSIDHRDMAGGYSCPLCAEIELRNRLDSLRSLAGGEDPLEWIKAAKQRLEEAEATLAYIWFVEGFKRGAGFRTVSNAPMPPDDVIWTRRPMSDGHDPR
jgi:hypothetical protein